jgi:hypothetical protein
MFKEIRGMMTKMSRNKERIRRKNGNSRMKTIISKSKIQ